MQVPGSREELPGPAPIERDMYKAVPFQVPSGRKSHLSGFGMGLGPASDVPQVGLAQALGYCMRFLLVVCSLFFCVLP